MEARAGGGAVTPGSGRPQGRPWGKASWRPSSVEAACGPSCLHRQKRPVARLTHCPCHKQEQVGESPPVPWDQRTPAAVSRPATGVSGSGAGVRHRALLPAPGRAAPSACLPPTRAAPLLLRSHRACGPGPIGSWRVHADLAVGAAASTSNLQACSWGDGRRPPPPPPASPKLGGQDTRTH